MAEEKQSYPQIPSRVWWGIRDVFKARPSARLTEQTLASQLSVQPSAAKAYLKQMQIVGLVDENGGATEIASKWRNDPTYSEAVEEILAHTYPKELIDAYPSGSADLKKVTEWFQYGGLGAGAARNKASTYVLIADGYPNDAEKAPPGRERKSVKDRPTGSEETRVQRKPAAATQGRSQKNDRISFPELNLNIQIHISADATTEQIEAIFAAMNKYLR